MEKERVKMEKSMMRHKRGSAMVGAIIISIVAGVAMAATMQSSFTEYKMSKRYLDSQHALNLAESGLEEAVRAYNAEDWSGWTAETGGYFKIESPAWLPAGMTGEIRVFAKDTSGNSPIIAAQGKVTDGHGSSISRQIMVDMSKTSRYANGILAKDRIQLKGNNVTVDSYDSARGHKSLFWGGSHNRFSNGSVASIAVRTEDEDPGVIVGNSDVYGYVALGSSGYNKRDLVGNNGFVAAYPSETFDPSRVTTDFRQTIDDVAAPNYSSYTNLSTVPAELGTPGGSMEYYQIDAISVAGSSILTIKGPTTLFVKGDLSFTGNAQLVINADAKLDLYVVGNLKLAGNGVKNPNKGPESLMIFGLGTAGGGQEIEFKGNANCAAVIDAPNASVSISGGGSANEGVSGAIVANDVTMNGTQRFTYDENLKNFGGGGGLKIDHWRELKTSAEQLPFHTPGSLAANM